MQISTEIGSIAKITGEEKAVELVAKAGFDAWDFSMIAMCKYNWQTKSLNPNDHQLAGADYLNFARKLRRIGEDNGIHCNQSHAPFPTYCDEIRPYLKRAIECTAEAGAKICIIHPDNYKTAEENAEIYNELLPFAKECNVQIATENMFAWDMEKDIAAPSACSHHDDFVKHLNVINDEFFIACLDIGHAEMSSLGTSAVEMIKAIGKKLKALHIHDNDKRRDLHQMPFSMNIDFNPIINALNEIGYDGYFTLEANRYLEGRDKNTVFEGICNMATATRKLAKMFEEK